MERDVDDAGFNCETETALNVVNETPQEAMGKFRIRQNEGFEFTSLFSCFRVSTCIRSIPEGCYRLSVVFMLVITGICFKPG